MEERLIIQVVGQVMVYDSSAKQWHPAGTSSGLSTVRLIHYLPNNTFRIHGQKISELKEVVLDSQITREVKYNRANEAFIQWHDSQAFWGLNFRRGSPDAESFFASVVQVLRILNQNNSQQQANLPPEILGNQQQQQSQQTQQGSAAIIQRSMQQQQMLQQQQQQQAPQQPLLQQQQPQMMSQPQAQTQLLGQGPPPTQIMQQQISNPQQILQQQQIHQHFMQHQQPQTQSQQPSHTQINHYQHQQQQLQIQQQQQQHQIQQQQVAPVVAAPIPPPPPPPPAPPANINNSRINGTVNNSATTAAVSATTNSSNLQHSPITNSSSNNLGVDSNVNRNGGSPNQVVSLANELARCQLRKVKLSRSDSEKESECNNNIANAKTTRAASLASDKLITDLNRKLASRREKSEQQGDQSMSNNNCGGNNASSTNGISGDKVQESWLADLIRKEISKEITKMKAEIIDAIKAEFRRDKSLQM